ncbi:unnamed protein product [Boreogadus saida]
MKKSMSLLDVRPLIWNHRWKEMYVGKEEQEQILCMQSQMRSQKPAVLRENLPSHLLFTFQCCQYPTSNPLYQPQMQAVPLEETILRIFSHLTSLIMTLVETSWQS